MTTNTDKPQAPMSAREDEDESSCRKPCDPNAGCEECAAYWERMVSEGFWDREQHRWTDKGWREITK